MKRVKEFSIAMVISLALSACDSGGSSSAPSKPANLAVAGSLKTLSFSWDSASGADYYQILVNPDGASGYSQVGSNMTGTSAKVEIPAHMTDWVNATYLVSACNDSGCTDSTAIDVTDEMLNTIGYLKASNSGADDFFGLSVAVSDDGKTIAVGAEYESSNSTGVNGDESNNSAYEAGAVYVFTNTSSGWSQQAYLKASNAEAGDSFGHALSLSEDGNILAVSALREDSAANGVNGNEADNSQIVAGAVYIFSRSGTTWSQDAYIKSHNSDSADRFGASVSLSDSGDTLAVGAIYESIGATNSGAAYVFYNDGSGWVQQGYLKASNLTNNDAFGKAISLSGDGDTLVVGSPYEDGSATGIDGADDDALSNAGAAYVFVREAGSWSEQAYIKSSNGGASDYFGLTVSLSDDGNLLAVGAIDEDSSATGVNGDDSDNSLFDSGAVYLFTRTGTSWSQSAYLKASNTGGDDNFGSSVSVSGNGQWIAIGSNEPSSATGINGDQNNDDTIDAGAVYLFGLNNGSWYQHAYIKPTLSDTYDYFGTYDHTVALSEDGQVLVVGANEEDSAATGIGGDETDNSLNNSGAVYLF